MSEVVVHPAGRGPHSATTAAPARASRSSFRARLRTVSVAAAMLVGAASAHAGLFDDDEARKAILDLRTRISQLEQRAQQQEQTVQQLQGSLLDLNNQNDQLRQQIAQLRGTNEELARALSDVQQNQKSLQQGVDDRLKKMEPQQVTLDGKTFSADPEEVQAYEAATATLRNGDFAGAINALTGFQRRYPSSGYADAVRYWLGNAQYGARDFKSAIGTFRAFIAAAPDHPRAPEALLAISNCQVELKDVNGAKKSLNDLVKQYPQSEAAQAARDRLRALR